MKQQTIERTIRLGLLTASTLSVMALTACAGRTAAWERKSNDAPLAAASADEAATLDQKAAALFAERIDLAKAEAAVQAYAEAASKAPTADRLVSLARAYYFVADSHYALADRSSDMMASYEKGLEAGEQALVLSSPAFTEKMKAGAKAEEAVKVVDASSVPALYWYATNLGKWAKAQGMTKMLFYKDKIRAYMTQAQSLDNKYFYAAPPRYFGVFFSVAPGFAGGDLNKSEVSFQEALSIEPNYFATKVLMAENLATKKQDRAMFEKLLNEVMKADPTVLADVVPENTFEQKKAARLLSKAEDLF